MKPEPESDQIFIHRSLPDAAFILLDDEKRLGVPFSAAKKLSSYALGLLVKTECGDSVGGSELFVAEEEKHPALFEQAMAELSALGYVYRKQIRRGMAYIVNTTPVDPEVAESKFAAMDREGGAL